jgi:hypothetical protein
LKDLVAMVNHLPIRGGRRALAAACLVLAAGLVGCGDGRGVKLYPVRGKLLYKGAPADGAEVTFYPKSDAGKDPVRPAGKVGPDGTFVLGSFRPSDGAPVGEYAVLVRWNKDGKVGHEKGKKRAHNVPVNFLQDRYANPAAPRFTAAVRPEANALSPFEIKD